jgi:hypothetical protein
MKSGRLFATFIFTLAIALAMFALIPNGAPAQDAIDERVSALETQVAQQADEIGDLQDRVEVLEGDSKGSTSTGRDAQTEKSGAGNSITISGNGDTVSDTFVLAPGNFKVSASVDVKGDFDGFAVWIYIDGSKDLLFNELIDQNGTWTGSAILDAGAGGEAYFAVENTDSTWTLTVESK